MNENASFTNTKITKSCTNNNEDTTNKKKKNSFLYFAIIFFLMSLIISIIFKSFIFAVSGESMMPTFYNGEVVVCNRFADKTSFSKNDIILFYSGKIGISSVNIKRIVATPGDSVQIIDGDLYVNHILIESEFDKMDTYGIALSELIVGEDEYFVLGDNRNNSLDSRYVGCIKSDHVLGNVVYTFD